MANAASQALEAAFPKLAGTSWTVESPVTDVYNCFAWAAGENHRRWDSGPKDFWPNEHANKYGIAWLVDAYRTVGFVVCRKNEQHVYDEQYERIVLYERNSVGTHAARLLPSGRWTSKIGYCEDIEHERPEDLNGTTYGEPIVYMKRRRTNGKRKIRKETANAQKPPPDASATDVRSDSRETPSDVPAGRPEAQDRPWRVPGKRNGGHF